MTAPVESLSREELKRMMLEAMRDEEDFLAKEEQGPPKSAKGSTTPQAESNNSQKGVILSYPDPLDAAKKFSATGRKKRYWQGCLYEYTGSAYQEKSIDDVKADIYRFLEMARVIVNQDTKETQPYLPNRNRVGEVLEALRATVNLPDTLRPPCFVTGNDDRREYLSVTNGLLDIETRKLIEPTPDFFTLNSLPFAYDRDAAQPVEWLKFLESVWPADQQAIDTLQEIFGYLLTADTSQQKIFCVVGPKRSGKGTIGRVMTALLGPDNVCAPTLGSLAQQFGLAGLIGKKAAIISDARLGGKVDQSAITERLLSISGEDHQGVPRKFLSDFNGPLNVRFVIFTNEIPRLADASGALPSRFILLTMKKSFLGQEDHGLTKRLMGELPGILNWSLDGLDLLNRRGFFIQPENGREAIQELSDLSSPILAFLRERCTQGPEHTVSTKSLYTAWCQWCEEQGRDYPGNLQSFGRDLRAAVPGLSLVQPGTDWGRQRMYQGVTLC
jgi:putative DNA primase/helicase